MNSAPEAAIFANFTRQLLKTEFHFTYYSLVPLVIGHLDSLFTQRVSEGLKLVHSALDPDLNFAQAGVFCLVKNIKTHLQKRDYEQMNQLYCELFKDESKAAD